MLRIALLASLLLLPAGPGGADDADAHVAQAGDIKVVHAWARAADGEEGAVFMDIENGGRRDDRLLEARTVLAREVEIHGAVLRDGEPSSQQMDAVEIPAGGEFVLEPRGVFLKLAGLTRPLVEGDTFAVELRFAAAGVLPVEVEVEAADALQHGHAGHAH